MGVMATTSPAGWLGDGIVRWLASCLPLNEPRPLSRFEKAVVEQSGVANARRLRLFLLERCGEIVR